jgi:hypothetical protein
MQSCPYTADDTLPPDGVAAFATTIPSPPPEVPPEELALPPMAMPAADLGEWAGFASADLDEQDGDT